MTCAVIKALFEDCFPLRESQLFLMRKQIMRMLDKSGLV